MTQRNDVYWRGMGVLGAVSPLHWPKRFDAVADLLAVPHDVFREVRRSGLAGHTLGGAQAVQAWRWLCYRSRNPVMLRRLGLDVRFRKRNTPLSLQQGLERMELIEAWPCSHRVLGSYLQIAFTVPGREAKRIGLDVSQGFTREVAEQVWRSLRRQRHYINATP